MATRFSARLVNDEPPSDAYRGVTQPSFSREGITKIGIRWQACFRSDGYQVLRLAGEWQTTIGCLPQGDAAFVFREKSFRHPMAFRFSAPLVNDGPPSDAYRWVTQPLFPGEGITKIGVRWLACCLKLARSWLSHRMPRLIAGIFPQPGEKPF
jgi:hypothetical protein